MKTKELHSSGLLHSLLAVL